MCSLVMKSKKSKKNLQIAPIRLKVTKDPVVSNKGSRKPFPQWSMYTLKPFPADHINSRTLSPVRKQKILPQWIKHIYNIIPMKEAEDSSPMDQSIPQCKSRRFFPSGSSTPKVSPVKKQKIFLQSPQHTMKEAENSSLVDHTSTKVTLLLSEFISTTPQRVSYSQVSHEQGRRFLPIHTYSSTSFHHP